MTEKTQTKTAVIIRGPSGCGKTTFARKQFPGACFLEADDFFENEEGEYQFDPAQLPQAHAQCLGAFCMALDAGLPLIVVANTFSQDWEWVNYMSIARLAGYDVRVLEFRLTTLDEVRQCAARNVHQVPVSAVAAQAVRFEPYKGATPLTLDCFNL